MTYLPCRLLAAVVLLAGTAAAFTPGNARAETYNTCAGFIDSVPATITQQGVWCLRKDLSTNITNGNAITIAANNVTIDCNDFKVGGLAAGNGSGAVGVYAYSRQNVTVRNCNVRGFLRGISLAYGAGHLVEDNRLDNNLLAGVEVSGENGLVQRNRVYDTGGTPAGSAIYGIQVDRADVLDNTVAGVFSVTDSRVQGIVVYGSQVIRNNRVRGLSGVESLAIVAHGLGSTVEGNSVYDVELWGIRGWNDDVVCSNNVVVGSATPFYRCLDNGGNVSL